jgi:single-stranded-DNA-specific exonuclease
VEPADLAASVAMLEATLELPASLCRLLALRGMAGQESARDFLKPRLDRLHDARHLTGLDDALARITSAIRQKQTILVHGDYDVDGICGAVLLTRTLRALGAQVVPFVPHRMSDGYDLGSAGVRAAAEARARLILTVDCGTVAHEAVRQAKAAGIDVVVTDHHTPGDTLPDAVAVVNPNRHDCSYPFKGLAGVGVAFKLCDALVSALGGDAEMLRWHLDLVALATIADLAPLSGENRILAAFGLRVLTQTRNPGLAALLRTVAIDTTRPITAGQVSHVLAPRINAVGRMGAAARGMRLLLADTEAEAESLAKLSEDENRTRRAVDRETLHEALDMLEANYDPARDRGIVLASPRWHPGVIGIVASRVVERLHRSTILLAIDAASGRARGSGRSIPGFHLYEAIRSCSHLLERYGGHRQAAGLEILPERIDAFRCEFDAYARSVLHEDQLVAVVGLDLELRLPDATDGLVTMLRHFGPFGIGNPAPTFVARNVALAAPPRLVGEGHARLLLEQDGARLPAIGFGMGAQLGALIAGQDTLDVAFHLQEHRWRGNSGLQARLIDTRPAT